MVRQRGAMSTTTGDPISDLLNRLRNGMRAGHERVEMPASRLREDLLRVLADEGYIASYRRVEEKGRPLLRVGLKYDPEGEPIVTGLERVSRPGRRVYAASKEIPEVLGGLGISIVSTSKGIVTGRAARESRLGGEILCNIW
ncbi:MAG TPA: 30S ribosomal protein S8 [Thermoanaerobaculia bacterium]|nr:30S ribosomal protein S8 [Thermoanaerobaculia bacterium]HXM77906.1 30S ribosomal protein S8 [Thermoanaerobaculia bacterium]